MSEKRASQIQKYNNMLYLITYITYMITSLSNVDYSILLTLLYSQALFCKPFALSCLSQLKNVKLQDQGVSLLTNKL